MPESKEWTMPEWMEKYRPLFYNTGGNSIEDLMNDEGTNPSNNIIRWSIIISVQAQFVLLERLHKEGKIS